MKQVVLYRMSLAPQMWLKDQSHESELCGYNLHGTVNSAEQHMTVFWWITIDDCSLSNDQFM